MPRLSLVKLAQEAVQEVLQPGDRAIDATVGNGHDTLFLARCVGQEGKVYGIDKQREALASARARLDRHGVAARVMLIHAGHEELLDFIPPDLHGKIKAIMFNLGYLPGSDHSLITQPATTLAALKAAQRLLLPGGRITLLAYTGHPGGREEAETVKRWVRELAADRYRVRIEAPASCQNEPPELILIEKSVVI